MQQPAHNLPVGNAPRAGHSCIYRNRLKRDLWWHEKVQRHGPLFASLRHFPLIEVKPRIIAPPIALAERIGHTEQQDPACAALFEPVAQCRCLDERQLLGGVEHIWAVSIRLNRSLSLRR